MAKRFFLGINIFGAARRRTTHAVIMGRHSNTTATKSPSNDRHGNASVLPDTKYTIAASDRRLKRERTCGNVDTLP